MDDPAGPIEHFEWGRYRIKGVLHSEDGDGVGKDVFLWKGEVKPWKERKGHTLKTRMVALVFGLGVTTLVIGNGVRGRIRVPERTRRAIRQSGIENLIITPTPEACTMYNRLVRNGEAVALLAHGTC